jgi:hypothetical protein
MASVSCRLLATHWKDAIKSFRYMYLVRTQVTAAIAAIAGLIVHDEGMNETEMVSLRTE